MNLYTERYGIRAPIKTTYSINIDMYSLLLDCCTKYKKNLTHIFTLNRHDDFTDNEYITFDDKKFNTKIKIRIPSLFRDKYDIICTPEGSKYDEYALLDFIEYFAQNINDISEQWNNSEYRNYKEIYCFETSDIFRTFKEEINGIFAETGLLYRLTDKKIIERIVENTPLTIEIENSFALVSEVGIKELLKDAIELYRTPNVKARQDSVEKIWDALERLKTYHTTMDKASSVKKIINEISGGNTKYYKLFDDEFKQLTYIGNNYRIRHHETDKVDITDEHYYDYFFNRCLSLIALAIKYLI